LIIMIVVQISQKFHDIEVSIPRIKKLVRQVCERFKLLNATVSIAIVDDNKMRELNTRFLNCKSATDCLSFDLSESATPETSGQNPKSSSSRGRSFELIVNAELALKEANLRGHSGEAELALYITHGLLHNLGFDDSTQSQAQKMHDTEDEILQKFGYGLVYNKNKY
jgi:probable rRNA maturation factor